MSDTDGPKRTGRPPKFPEEGARVQLSVRLKPSTGKALREAAEKNNRSLAEEVEHRVEATLRVVGDFSEDFELAVSKRTMELQHRLDRAEKKITADAYLYRLNIAVEKRYALNLEKIVFGYSVRLYTRLFNLLGNRFQKIVAFGKDVSFERVTTIEMRIKQQDIEIEECYYQIESLTNQLRDKAESDKIRTAEALKRIEEVKKQIAETQSRIDLRNAEVKENSSLPDLTDTPSHASASPASSRVARRR